MTRRSGAISARRTSLRSCPLAEAQKQRLTLIEPMTGDEAEQQLAEIYQAPPDIVAEAKALAGK